MPREERAELVETKMAKALAVQIPKLGLSDSYSKPDDAGLDAMMPL